jgi:GAF domain
VATLVAHGVEPSEVFDAVTNEMCRYVPADCAGLWRYETSGEITLVATAYLSASAPAKWPVGPRTPIAGNILASMVQRTGGPARMDSYENVGGPIAARARDAGVCTAVGVPIIIDGRVWGAAGVGSMRPRPMPADTEVRVGRFAELIAAAPRPYPWSHIGQIRSMSSVHPVLSRRRLRAITGLESSSAVSWSSKGPSNAAVSWMARTSRSVTFGRI